MKSRCYPLLFIVLVLGLTACWYVASGRPATVLAEQHKRSLPVQPLTPQEQAESEFQQLQQQIDQSPQDSVLWAQLGNIICLTIILPMRRRPISGHWHCGGECRTVLGVGNGALLPGWAAYYPAGGEQYSKGLGTG